MCQFTLLAGQIGKRSILTYLILTKWYAGFQIPPTFMHTQGYRLWTRSQVRQWTACIPAPPGTTAPQHGLRTEECILEVYHDAANQHHAHATT